MSGETGALTMTVLGYQTVVFISPSVCLSPLPDFSPDLLVQEGEQFLDKWTWKEQKQSKIKSAEQEEIARIDFWC